MSAHRGFRALAALVLLPALLVGTAVVTTVAAGQIPGTVFIQTAPSLRGVHLWVGSSTVTTGPDGSATVRVADFNGIAARISLASTVLDSRNTLALAYVKPAPHTAKYQSNLTIGLDVTSQVTLRISGRAAGVTPSQVHAVRLHSVTGQSILVDPQRTPTVNLLSRKPRLVAGVIVPQVVTWSVDSLHAAPGVSITTQRAKFDPLSGPIWALLIRPVAGTVILDTVPVTAGVSFLLEGASFSTDAKGHAKVPVADLNSGALQLSLTTDQATGSTVSLLGVSRLTPATAFQRHLIAALAVSRPVSLSFAAPDGRAVSVQRVAEVQLTGGRGTVMVKGAQLQDPVSLLSIEPKLVDSTWKPQQVTYSVARVSVEGSDAVFAGQQRFNPNTAQKWPISVSVYDVNVTVFDVIFGNRLSSPAYVTRPDGLRYAVHLGAQRPALLPSLVRGEYTLTAKSAVIGASSKILVSKNSHIELRVFTLTDVLVLLLFALGMSLSVVMLGRRWARRHP